MTRRSRGAVRRARLGQDRAAVSDVLGSLLLVGITVVSAVGLGLLLLSFDGPADRLQADLEFRTDPGTGGWGTGDETLQVVHLGGEAIPSDGLVIRFTRGGTEHCFGDADGCLPLASDFGDGELSIGETWVASTTLTLQSDTALDVSVVLVGEVSQLIAAGSVSGSDETDIVDCITDTSAPTSSFSHEDLATTKGTANFTVILEADDFCGAVNTTALPDLHYRLTPSLSGVPDDYADSGSNLGGMTWVPSVGFVLDIPAPGGLGWASAYGRTLEFFASGLTDTATPANSANTSVESELIQVVGASASPPDDVTLTAGAFTAAGPESGLNADGGTVAQLQEACMVDLPTGILAVYVQNLCGTVAGGQGVTDAANALFSDASDAHSTHSGSGNYVEVSGFDVAGLPPGDITTFTIVWEGERANGGTAPILALEFNLGPDYASTSTGWLNAGTFTPPNSEGTTTVTVVSGLTLGGPWTADQVSNMHLRARVTNNTTKDVDTDDLHLRVTYPGSTTVRDLDAEFEWDHAALANDSVIRQLQVEYQVASGTESYTVEVAEDAAGTSWTSCPNLTSTTMVAYTCDLTKNQVLQGPVVRIRQAASVDTAAPSILQLDYVRMLVVQ